MALNIKSGEADRLARHLAQLAGESITEAVTHALQERLARLEGQRRRRGLRDEIGRIQQRLAVLPRLDERSDEEILGYDDAGLPS
ncbi:MAG: type II toxin-antitoxin system VapB family antitoxin [Longimicrobiales bacterium]|nr:type II toxin-antitoxin system VapB family antitoxin [Longimicrobiales bacterium]